MKSSASWDNVPETDAAPRKAHKYMPCCLVCYTAELAPKPVGKREADRIACGHQNAYHHNVTILAR